MERLRQLGERGTWPSRRAMRASLWLVLWLSTALLPALYRKEAFSLPWALKLLSAPLVFGLAHALEKQSPRWAELLFLAMTPTALALGMTTLGGELALSTYSPGLLLLASTVLALYFVAALSVLDREEPRRSVEQRPLGELVGSPLSRRKKLLSSLLLSLLALVGAVGVAFGTWASPAHYREHWGEAAAHGATLSALAAGLLAAGAILAIAPKLRIDKGESVRVQRAPRLAAWMAVVAVSGAAVYLLATR